MYMSKSFGEFKIIEDKGWDKVLIEFVNTGYRLLTRRDKVKSGSVKDVLLPTVHSIGFMGEGQFKANTRAYKTWNHMLSRCYNPNDKEYVRYGAKGVAVCTEWYNYQNYAAWYLIHAFDGCHIDKDIKIKGNKIYSPDNCLAVNPRANSIEANAITASFISPDGSIHHVYNITQFASDNNLQQSCMSQVYTGTRKSHKGWRKV